MLVDLHVLLLRLPSAIQHTLCAIHGTTAETPHFPAFPVSFVLQREASAVQLRHSSYFCSSSVISSALAFRSSSSLSIPSFCSTACRRVKIFLAFIIFASPKSAFLLILQRAQAASKCPETTQCHYESLNCPKQLSKSLPAHYRCQRVRKCSRQLSAQHSTSPQNSLQNQQTSLNPTVQEPTSLAAPNRSTSNAQKHYTSQLTGQSQLQGETLC